MNLRKYKNFCPPTIGRTILSDYTWDEFKLLFLSEIITVTIQRRLNAPLKLAQRLLGSKGARETTNLPSTTTYILSLLISISASYHHLQQCVSDVLYLTLDVTFVTNGGELVIQLFSGSEDPLGLIGELLSEIYRIMRPYTKTISRSCIG